MDRPKLIDIGWHNYGAGNAKTRFSECPRCGTVYPWARSGYGTCGEYRHTNYPMCNGSAISHCGCREDATSIKPK